MLSIIARTAAIPGHRHWVQFGVAAILLVVGGFARADGTVDFRLSQLSSMPFVWSEPQATRLFGVPAHLRFFTSTDSVHRSAQTLAANTAIFQRVIALGNKIVLSGIDREQHWVAEIEPQGTGSFGLVSVLDINEGRLQRLAQGPVTRAYSWLPTHAKLHFSQRSSLKKGHVSQQVYVIAWPVILVDAYVEKNLRLAGWHQARARASLKDAHIWRQGSAELILVSNEAFGLTSLFLQHFE